MLSLQHEKGTREIKKNIWALSGNSLTTETLLSCVTDINWYDDNTKTGLATTHLQHTSHRLVFF